MKTAQRLAALSQPQWLKNKMVPLISEDDGEHALQLVERCEHRITLWQLEIANSLAGEFGHGWAGDFSRFDGLEENPELIEVLEVMASNGGLADTAGIMLPRIDEAGDVVYTTTTKRLHWRISDRQETGRVITIEVHRPQGLAFSITLRPPSEPRASWQFIVKKGMVPFRFDHLEAAQKAVRGIGRAEVARKEYVHHLWTSLWLWASLVKEAVDDESAVSLV